MAWSIEGQFFECCNCEVVCPCSAYPFQGADYDRCVTVLAFHVDSGQIEEVSVAGTNVAVLGDAPKYILEGNWRVGLLVDAGADRGVPSSDRGRALACEVTLSKA